MQNVDEKQIDPSYIIYRHVLSQKFMLPPTGVASSSSANKDFSKGSFQPFWLEKKSALFLSDYYTAPVSHSNCSTVVSNLWNNLRGHTTFAS